MTENHYTETYFIRVYSLLFYLCSSLAHVFNICTWKAKENSEKKNLHEHDFILPLFSYGLSGSSRQSSSWEIYRALWRSLVSRNPSVIKYKPFSSCNFLCLQWFEQFTTSRYLAVGKYIVLTVYTILDSKGVYLLDEIEGLLFYPPIHKTISALNPFVESFKLRA
jgi:hypothetical protein